MCAYGVERLAAQSPLGARHRTESTGAAKAFGEAMCNTEVSSRAVATQRHFAATQRHFTARAELVARRQRQPVLRGSPACLQYLKASPVALALPQVTHSTHRTAAHSLGRSEAGPLHCLSNVFSLPFHDLSLTVFGSCGCSSSQRSGSWTSSRRSSSPRSRQRSWTWSPPGSRRSTAHAMPR